MRWKNERDESGMITNNMGQNYTWKPYSSIIFHHRHNICTGQENHEDDTFKLPNYDKKIQGLEPQASEHLRQSGSTPNNIQIPIHNPNTKFRTKSSQMNIHLLRQIYIPKGMTQLKAWLQTRV